MQATIAVEARLASNKSGTSNVAALKAMYGEFFTVDTSNRAPLPFSGAFSCFRFRAFLLFLLLPCASAVLMAVVLVSWASGWLETADVLGGLDADADNEAMGIEWAILDVPSSFAIQLLLARLVWQLHSVNRAGGQYETLSQNSVPKAWTRRLRIVMGAFFVLWAAWLALRISQEVRRNETEEEETRWLTVLRTTRFWLLLVSFPAIVLSVCQMSAAVAAVVVELSDLTLLIRTCEQSIWESAVIEASKNVVQHLPDARVVEPWPRRDLYDDGTVRAAAGEVLDQPRVELLGVCFRLLGGRVGIVGVAAADRDWLQKGGEGSDGSCARRTRDVAGFSRSGDQALLCSVERGALGVQVDWCARDRSRDGARVWRRGHAAHADGEIRRRQVRAA